MKLTKLIDFVFSHSEQFQAISERDDYHPEPSLLDHIKIVFDRAQESGDVNLQVTALLHDIGKIYTYAEYKNSYGHEETSAWIAIENSNCISSYF